MDSLPTPMLPATASSSHIDEAEDIAPPSSSHTREEVEDADFRQVANPSDIIVLPLNCTHGEAIQHFSRTIPTNEYGLPAYYIRSDFLDWTRIEAYGNISMSHVEAAAEVLSYEEGYPTQKTGSPWWLQLKHEPFDAYLLFQAFLELAEDEGIRLLDTLSIRQQVALERLQDLSKEYYWSARARAYDLFIVAAEAKKREHRTRRMENSHFNVAGGVLDAIIKRVNNEPDLIQKMDPKELFALFEQMVKVQRLSLGLTGQAASSTPQLPMSPGASVEVTLRQLTKNVGLSGQAQESIHDKLKLLMGDESTALMAQELVIKATTGNQVYDSNLRPPHEGAV